MANDDVYRPQKKSISSDDISEIPVYNPGSEGPAEEGLKLSGNIPAQFRDPQFREALERPSVDGLFDNRTGGSDKFKQLMEGLNKTSKHERIVLPSLGRFYDGSDGPTNGVLHIRKMTGEEEELLATPNLVKKGQAMNMIFNNCIQESYNSEDFVTQDRVYLLIFLRGISYSQDYDIEVRCPACSSKFASSVDLNGFMIDQCPPEYSANSLKDVLPITGFKFSYRLARGSDEQDVQNYRDVKLKSFSGAVDDSLHYRTAQLVNEIEGLNDKEELKKIIEKLPMGDVAFLRDVVSQPPFGVDTKFEIDCPRCTETFETELQIEANFFFPKGRKKKLA
jgi:phage FluMu protein Com